jgi:hypothetical protein
VAGIEGPRLLNLNEIRLRRAYDDTKSKPGDVEL